MPSAYFASTTVAEATDTGGIGNDFDSAAWTNASNGSIKSDSQADVPSGYPGSPENDAANWASADVSSASFSGTAKVLRVTGLVYATDGTTGIASKIPATATNIMLWPYLRFFDRNGSGSGANYTLYYKPRDDTGGFGTRMQVLVAELAAANVGIAGVGIRDGTATTGKWANVSLVGSSAAISLTYAQVAAAGFGYILKTAADNALSASTQWGFNGIGAYATWDESGSMRSRSGRTIGFPRTAR